MFGKRKPIKFGKLKYTYGRTPRIDVGTNKRKKVVIRAKNPAKTKRITIWVLAMVMIAGLTYLTYFMFFSNYFTFLKLHVIQEGLEEKNTVFDPYFKGIKGENLILIDTDKIQEKILADHPEFEKIRIIKIYPDKMQVETNQYPLVANVINTIGETQEKHIVNQMGISVHRNTENPNLKYIKIVTAEPLNPKTPLLSKEKLEYTLGAIDHFEEKFGMKVFDAEYLTKAREIHLKTEKYFYVWLDTERPYEKQFAKLKQVVPKLDIQNTPLSYIDLRISGVSGNKIIYKRR